MKLIIVSLLTSAAATGGWVVHDQLPALQSATAPPAATAPAAAPAGSVAVSIEISDDGKVIARPAPAGAPRATGKAAAQPTKASREPAEAPTAPGTRVVVVSAPPPAEPSAAASEPSSPAATAEPTSGASATPTATPAATPAYANCNAVRAAGKAPIHRGDPGWADKLDRNGDGVACT